MLKGAKVACFENCNKKTGHPLKECLKSDREVHYILKNKLSSPTAIISTKGSKFYQDKISLLIVYVI
jgi:hypothetical protein